MNWLLYLALLVFLFHFAPVIFWLLVAVHVLVAAGYYIWRGCISLKPYIREIANR